MELSLFKTETNKKMINDISLYLTLEPLVSSGMSEFQMDNFVINDHLTPYRKLRQAIIETKARLENITSYGFDLEDLDLKREKIISEYNKALSSTDFHNRQKDLELRRCDFEINRKKSLLEQMKSEADFFLNVIEEITNTHFDGKDSIAALMVDKSFHFNHEKDYWVKRLTRSVFSDFINYGTISKGLLESITCLKPEEQVEIISGAMDNQLKFHVALETTKKNLLEIIK